VYFTRGELKLRNYRSLQTPLRREAPSENFVQYIAETKNKKEHLGE
jgi:hypothetical protein